MIDSFSNPTFSDLIFSQQQIPIFQNKVYPTRQESLKVALGRVELAQSQNSGFVFNRIFDPLIMNYDLNYQNEQGNSLIFREHLKSVMDLLETFDISGKRVIEIGCGKGDFLEMMIHNNLDCWGFDPTYEGENPRITKDYFGEKYSGVNGDVIIMRHTMEHISEPFSFLGLIAKANNFKGSIFIEVPTFDWIVFKNAYWDIFYEHCNYFTQQTLGCMFTESHTGSFFGGQYIYLWADLANLRDTIPQQAFSKTDIGKMQDKLSYYKNFVAANPSLAIWGAGAKGSTFLNLMDPCASNIEYVIDINPVKQSKFIGGSGHPIYSPKKLSESPVKNLLVMNDNYLPEIEKITSGLNLNIFTL